MSQLYNITSEALIASNYRPIHAGDDYDHQFTVTRGGSALDLTSAQIWFTVKESETEEDDEAKLQLASANAGGSSEEIELTDPESGKFTVKFRGEGAKSTSNIAGLWNYDIQVKLNTGDVKIITIAYGEIEFLKNITRTTA